MFEVKVTYRPAVSAPEIVYNETFDAPDWKTALIAATEVVEGEPEPSVRRLFGATRVKGDDRDPALPLHQHMTCEGMVDCHIADCDVYEIQRRAREPLYAVPQEFTDSYVANELDSACDLGDEYNSCPAVSIENIMCALGSGHEGDHFDYLGRNWP